VQNQQGSRMRNELRQSLALLPGRSNPGIGITKPTERRVEKFVCGRSAFTGALPIERPAKNELCRPIMFSSHPSKPMVNERRLTDPSPGNDGDDVDLAVCPCAVQESDVLLSPKNILSGYRQSRY